MGTSRMDLHATHHLVAQYNQVQLFMMHTSSLAQHWRRHNEREAEAYKLFFVQSSTVHHPQGHRPPLFSSDQMTY